MIKQAYLLLLFGMLTLFSSCYIFTPVNSEFETSETVGKGNVSVQGHISENKLGLTYNKRLKTLWFFESDTSRWTLIDQAVLRKNSNQNLSLKADVGILKNLDASLQYGFSRVEFSEAYFVENGIYDTEYFSMALKGKFEENFAAKTKVSFLQPGILFPSKEPATAKRLKFTTIEQQFIYSKKFKEGKLEPYIIGKGQLHFTDKELVSLRAGLNVGIGFNSPSQNWFLRTEIGGLLSLGTFNYSGGISVGYIFNSKKKR